MYLTASTITNLGGLSWLGCVLAHLFYAAQGSYITGCSTVDFAAGSQISIR